MFRTFIAKDVYIFIKYFIGHLHWNEEVALSNDLYYVSNISIRYNDNVSKKSTV